MASMGSNQKIFAGLFYMDDLESDVQLLSEQVSSSSQGWDGIHAVSVGNEWINNGEYTVDEVSTAVSSVRKMLTADGYSGYVVTVDVWVQYEDNTKLCDISDFIAVNCHPYWDGGVQPGDAGTWLQTQMANLQSVCGGKDILITETGWRTQGDTFGTYGVPSVANQVAAMQSIGETVGSQVIMFTPYNDYWKDPGDFGVEQYWGYLGDDPDATT
ncbi:glycoside hydrolase family 17 protein [[Candida] arabinofermentans NRRL YB-2248]|uniref:Glycoside hydrolase family 17 protein n=1 Tax=[Candida] arabinofermentans NRRL YB-2248 TaxID=983967 RepID=A0A1E4T4M7_9ASCO|nr:glycoside hydrolase family 17 protein [[Candida] arabinofermentans NRRL YB-2248]